MTDVDGKIEGCIDISDENGTVIGALCKDTSGPFFVPNEDKKNIVSAEKIELTLGAYNITEEEMKKVKAFLD